MDALSSREPLALVFNCHVNGLGIIRSLGERGVPVLALDHNPRAIGLASRYATKVICPNPEESESKFISFLVTLGGKLWQKGVLYPTNDTWLIAVSKNRERLEPFYTLPFSGWDVIKRCTAKAEMYALAEEAGVPIPRTLVLRDLQQAEASRSDIPFPCIVKPSSPWSFPKELGSRVMSFSTWPELQSWLAANNDRIVREGIRVVVQEKIPGDARELYTFASYSDPFGTVVAHAVIRKIRQHPAEAGTIRIGEIVREERVVELGRRLVERIGYYGLANVEFKKDPRDSVFRLMEINPRSGMSNYLVTKAGANLAYLSYCDAIGRRRPNSASGSPGDVGQVWVVLWTALYDIVRRAVRHPLSAEVLKGSLEDLWMLLRRCKVFAVCSLRDPLPAAAFFWWNVRSLIRRDWNEQRDIR